jgi:hypothetical protein
LVSSREVVGVGVVIFAVTSADYVAVTFSVAITVAAAIVLNCISLNGQPHPLIRQTLLPLSVIVLLAIPRKWPGLWVANITTPSARTTFSMPVPQFSAMLGCLASNSSPNDQLDLVRRDCGCRKDDTQCGVDGVWSVC